MSSTNRRVNTASHLNESVYQVTLNCAYCNIIWEYCICIVLKFENGLEISTESKILRCAWKICYRGTWNASLDQKQGSRETCRLGYIVCCVAWIGFMLLFLISCKLIKTNLRWWSVAEKMNCKRWVNFVCRKENDKRQI